MRAKSKEMQSKFEEYEAERKALQAENQSMKTFKTDSEQLAKEKQANAEVTAKCESLAAQCSTLKTRFDEQLARQANSDQTIQSQQEKLAAFEQKTQSLLAEKAEAVGTQDRLQSDLEDLKCSNKGFEQENARLVKDRDSNLQLIHELTA